ncbi:MAG TPA: hypothetical protein VJ698_24290 [Noviherbaspirillum sp.]|uniref:hypothetical protein n=1 Tax=Noviherbaspirillum sp. TaxID=1926288 RepID=UPI002B462CF2|nr:hypothetical protein [Noviherbaspirillum sp.]HJV88607.1 hypothetical protein [Noviherbaspirillum sp.]
MKTLTIKDLSVTEELDRDAMAAVHGGTGMGSYPYYWGGPSLSVNKNDFSFDAQQLLSQSQNTEVNNGNNVAFSDNITANVKPTQNGTNKINFG